MRRSPEVQEMLDKQADNIVEAAAMFVDLNGVNVVTRMLPSIIMLTVINSIPAGFDVRNFNDEIDRITSEIYDNNNQNRIACAAGYMLIAARLILDAVCVMDITEYGEPNE